MNYCRQCRAEVTETDFECGFCTQCFFPLEHELEMKSQYGSPEHRSYGHMKQRILNPKNPRYHRYGGRGIVICSRWLESFQNFYEDMGPRPVGTSLERRDNNGNYEPNNCYWATPKEQQNNMCRNVRIRYQERSLTIAQWSRELGIKTVTIRARLRRGWDTKHILHTNTTKDAGKRKRGLI